MYFLILSTRLKNWFSGKFILNSKYLFLQNEFLSICENLTMTTMTISVQVDAGRILLEEGHPKPNQVLTTPD